MHLVASLSVTEPLKLKNEPNNPQRIICRQNQFLNICDPSSVTLVHSYLTQLPTPPPTYCVSHLMWCYFTPLSVQHSLTCTADLVLERLSHRVSTLTFGSELESDKTPDTKERDAPAETEESRAPAPSL